MGDFFMKKDIEVLNKIKTIVDMGVINIDEVLDKVSDACLEKIMIDEKKEYLCLKSDITDLLNDYDEKGSNVGIVTRISNDIYTNMKIKGKDNDKEIAKMMVEGTNKGILEVTSLINEKKYKNNKISKVLNKLLKTLESNIIDLKKYL